jgi:hypothetical protein
MFALMMLGTIFLGHGVVAGQPQTAATEPVVASPLTSNLNSFSLGDAPAQTQSLLRDIAIAAIPLEYENDKQWGKTKEVWNGVHLKMDGLKLKTQRKRKEVNQGTWKRQRISLVEPDKNLHIQIGELQELAPGRAAFQLTMSAKLDLFAQRQEWQRDIRLYSISAEATADVDLTVDFEMTTELDLDKMPPDLILQPEAKKAELRLGQFKLHRISKADGPIVREFGDGLEGIFRRYLTDNQDKLTEKLNKAITKNQDKMRVSVTEMVRPKWMSSE